ncbi:type II secretion system F family protein [Endozoicomonadaceae bacterium StTr2]
MIPVEGSDSSGFYSLLASLGLALLMVVIIKGYFSLQYSRRWLGLPHRLTSWGRLATVFFERFAYQRKEIENNLIQAGIYNTKLATYYLPAKIALTFIIAILILVLGPQFGISQRNHQLLFIVLGMVAMIVLPDIWLRVLQKKRTFKITQKLPYMIDLMAVCIQTGMTIETAIAYLGNELRSFDRDIAYILRQLDARARIIGMEKALEELQDKVPSPAIHSFAYTLNQSLLYGSSIFEVLMRLSGNLREVSMMELEEKAGKLSAKMSVPLVLFIMFPIVVMITAPSIMRLMTHG